MFCRVKHFKNNFTIMIQIITGASNFTATPTLNFPELT